MKILFIRFSSIGDIVLTTPVIRCVKQQLGADIHFLTKQSFRAVLVANPYIDRLVTIQSDVKEVLYSLQQEKYDYILDLHHNTRSWQVKRALGGKSYSFNKINIAKWLIVNFKINRLPAVHIVDRYLDTARTLGVYNDGRGLDYFIPPEDELLVGSPEFQQIFMPPAALPFSFIAFVIGAAHATKRLPTEKIISICQKIRQPIILLGGPEDAATGEQIAQAAGAHVYNACGKLRLNQSASLVRQAAQVITHDTGLMHIAAAFRKDIISIWGNTIPEFGMYPYYPQGENRNISLEIKGLACRPCSKIGYARCPKGHFRCMRAISETPFEALI
ncbi:MAG TPA: glycosyltransferase family 9 protein [Saprospiraceae bacterium]|nr:glycosyltransferase family 9 protein [Saprospiraceae bacterium]HMP13225.1 glycosyltransferase family 9 protein [Saprospiraceae bacterium]